MCGLAFYEAFDGWGKRKAAQQGGHDMNRTILLLCAAVMAAPAHADEATQAEARAFLADAMKQENISKFKISEPSGQFAGWDAVYSIGPDMIGAVLIAPTVSEEDAADSLKSNGKNFCTGKADATITHEGDTIFVKADCVDSKSGDTFKVSYAVKPREAGGSIIISGGRLPPGAREPPGATLLAEVFAAMALVVGIGRWRAKRRAADGAKIDAA
jgi:hypothetical protein